MVLWHATLTFHILFFLSNVSLSLSTRPLFVHQVFLHALSSCPFVNRYLCLSWRDSNVGGGIQGHDGVTAASGLSDSLRRDHTSSSAGRAGFGHNLSRSDRAAGVTEKKDG